MKHYKPRLAAILAVALLYPAAAFADCDDVYRDATRDLYRSSEKISVYHAVFDKVCTSSGEVRSDADNTTIGLVYDTISFDFGNSGSSARQTVEKFCQDYRETRFSSAYSDIASSKVVVEALQNYNVCRQAEIDSGVSISHVFVEPDGIIFSFDFANTTTSFAVDDVVVENFVCSTTSVGTDGKRVVLGGQRHEFEKNFSIVCERDFTTVYNSEAPTLPAELEAMDEAAVVMFADPAKAPPADDRRVFPAGSVGIATNFGAYRVSMPLDEQYPNSLASEATARLNEAATTISALETERDGLKAKLETAVSKLEGLAVNQDLVVIGEYNPGLIPGPMATRHFGCGTSWETVELQLCKAKGKNQIKVTRTYGGNRCGYTWALVSCVSTPE